MLFGDSTCEVHERGVHQRSHDKDSVTEDQNFTNRIPREHSSEGEQVEYDHVDQLAYECRAVVAQPQEALLFAELVFGPFPPGMIGPHVEHFANGVGEQACKHHARGVGEHGANRFCHGVAGGRNVQEPALRNQNEGHVCKNADFNAAARFFLAVNFTHDIGGEECRGENHVAERGVEPEGVHQNQNFDVGGNGANHRPGENALLAEEAEEGDESAEEHEDGGDKDKFVLHSSKKFEVESGL